MTRQLVVRSPQSDYDARFPVVTRIDLQGIDVVFGWAGPPSRTAELAPDEVLVEVSTFAVNYRDRALTWDKAYRLKDADSARWAGFGSEFCGKVVAVGADEWNDLMGVRVIGCNDFDPDGDSPQGVATNDASRALLKLKARKVVATPSSLSDAEACTFGLAAQTAASMVRRGQVGEGSRVLVTGGNSHTSRFIAQIAAHVGGEVTVISRGENRWPHLESVATWVTMEQLLEQPPSESNRFDAILDPFIDVYAGLTMPYIKQSGVYVTCGFANQIPSEEGDQSLLRDVMLPAMVRCARIEVNAIGKAHDFDLAVAALEEGTLKCPAPVEFSESDAEEFVLASFGKIKAPGRPVLHYTNTSERS